MIDNALRGLSSVKQRTLRIVIPPSPIESRGGHVARPPRLDERVIAAYLLSPTTINAPEPVDRVTRAARVYATEASMKVKIFDYGQRLDLFRSEENKLENIINEWLSLNPNITIKDVRLGSAILPTAGEQVSNYESFNTFTQVLIFYQESLD